MCESTNKHYYEYIRSNKYETTFGHNLLSITSSVVSVVGDRGIVQSFTKNEHNFTKIEIFTRYLTFTRNFGFTNHLALVL